MERPKRVPTVGTLFGKPIFESIISDDKRYVFDRLAECDAEGCTLDQLEANEILIRPGLIYRQA